MNISGTKVVIIGTGNVGATTAYSLTVQGVCSELVLIDRNKEKAIGEVMDCSIALSILIEIPASVLVIIPIAKMPILLSLQPVQHEGLSRD